MMADLTCCVGKHSTLCLSIQRGEFCKTPVTRHQMALTYCILARNDGDEFLMTHHPHSLLIIKDISIFGDECFSFQLKIKSSSFTLHSKNNSIFAKDNI